MPNGTFWNATFWKRMCCKGTRRPPQANLDRRIGCEDANAESLAPYVTLVTLQRRLVWPVATASKRSGETLNNLDQADDRTVEGVHILGRYPIFEVGSAPRFIDLVAVDESPGHLEAGDKA